MSCFVLSCLVYLSTALPGSTLGQLWPSMRVSIHQSTGTLRFVLVAGVAASALSSAVTGRLSTRMAKGWLLALGTMAISAALALESAAPALWVIAFGSAVFGLGFGTIDTVLNAHAARHFSARNITWMHASYGLGAMLGPLLVTVMLAGGLSWRDATGLMAGVVAFTGALLAVTRRSWEQPAYSGTASYRRASPSAATGAPRMPRRSRALVAAVTFMAVEDGIESAAGVWGFVFLTAGRGLPATAAGIVVSAYWAMMFIGRMLLGPLADRLGPSRVLAGSVTAVPLGALLTAVPAQAPIAVAGMMLLGLATAPVFPLITLTAGTRARADTVAATVGLQITASTIGGALLPAGIGLVVGTLGAQAVGQSLLALGLVACGVYWAALHTAPDGEIG
ncbi:MFS transporter [Catenulispora rubra]|uniref:MFS transporter n=1 Tax=Catenulispora rubra TaxID=280293 RepID=UPI00189277C7|nr:MFS transporter [Catenulispora rubra]